MTKRAKDILWLIAAVIILGLLIWSGIRPETSIQNVRVTIICATPQVTSCHAPSPAPHRS